MSPFNYAEQIRAAAADPWRNGQQPRHLPLQSERLYQALQGLGATARLVTLPAESHGYRARESILHMLWEQDRWLERYLGRASAAKTLG